MKYGSFSDPLSTSCELLVEVEGVAFSDSGEEEAEESCSNGEGAMLEGVEC